MPAADFRIHEYGIPRINTSEGLSLREDVLFTNSKGEEKSSLRKRNEKVLSKLRPALQRILLADETILYVARARSPLSVLEQLTRHGGRQSWQLAPWLLPISAFYFFQLSAMARGGKAFGLCSGAIFGN